ncbi:MAG: family 20 glycosylhydrolase, partial [Verrucomicrobia bacterium]|nr:family 20 glycosylhydrolase [Verrucomicrobiota bacterium]
MKSCFIAAQVVFLLATMPGIAESPALIPRPQKMEARDGFFALLPGTKITAGPGSRATAIFLARRLKTSTGYPLTVDGGASANAGILLTTNSADAALGAEGYTLAAATNLIVIRAPTQAGLFYGAQTLLQLLPPEIFSPSVVTNVDWNIPCVRIRDWPRFKWRGLMLDVSRHFFDKAEVEQILDEMALHKLNVFHWHLTDDQGWRIEIKKYPRLARISAWRASSAIQPPRESLKVAEALNAHPAWAAVASSKF